MDYREIGRNVLEMEAQAIRKISDGLDDSFNGAVELLFNCQGRVVVVGMGKCFHISRKIAASLASTGTPAFAVHPGESFHGDLGMFCKGDVVLALSYSGNTSEMTAILPSLRERGAKIIALTGGKDSVLAKAADIVIDCHVDREACSFGMVPTCSSTVQLAIGDALAMALVEKRNFSEKDFALLHPGGSLGRQMRKVCNAMLCGGKLASLAGSCTLSEALNELLDKRSGALCIAENGLLSGLLTKEALLAALKSGSGLDTKVQEIMLKKPVTISPMERISAAAPLFAKANCGFLPVTDENGALLGLLDQSLI